jgi:hypothetical protein
MSKIHSDQIEKTQQLLDGIKNNQNLLKNKGLDGSFIKQLESENNLLMAYNDENEKLKVDLKAKIQRANQKLDEIKNKVNIAKKIIKRDFEQEKWRHFGVSDKR